MEHRWGHRHDVDRMVLLRAADWQVLGRIRNLSVSGAYIRCPVPATQVTRIQVDLRMGSRFGRLAAEVTRVTADGIGVEWSVLAPAEVVRLLTRPEPRRLADAVVESESRVAAMPGQAAFRA